MNSDPDDPGKRDTFYYVDASQDDSEYEYEDESESDTANTNNQIYISLSDDTSSDVLSHILEGDSKPSTSSSQEKEIPIFHESKKTKVVESTRNPCNEKRKNDTTKGVLSDDKILEELFKVSEDDIDQSTSAPQEKGIPILDESEKVKMADSTNNSSSGKRKRRRKVPLIEKDNNRKQPLHQRVCKFQHIWLFMDEFKDWVVKTDKVNSRGHEMVECKCCSVYLKAHKGVLDHHRRTKIHNTCLEIDKSTEHKPQSPLDLRTRRFELKILALIASGNLPLSLLDTLIPLLQYLLPQIDEVQGMKLHHTRGTQLLHMMGDEFQEELHAKLREELFGFIFDETTDCSTTKQLATGVTYFDKEVGAPVETFFDIIEPPGGTAVEIANCLKDSVESKNIPLSNVAGMCADTCNTNFGEQNSVSVHLKDSIPNLVIIKCVCHLINLVSRKAFEKLPKEIDEMLHRFAKHFGKSSKAVAAFRDLQLLMEAETHKILFLSGTRWLAHGQCIKRVLEQYPVLQKYFYDLEIQFEKQKKKVEKFRSINAILQPPITKLYLEFSSYILGILDRFNKLFQGEVGKLFLLKPRLEKMMSELMCCYIQKKFVDECTNLFTFDHTDQYYSKKRDLFYVGIEGQITLDDLKKNPKFNTDVEFFLTCVHGFFIELISQLKHYFSFVFTDKFFALAEIVNPALEPKKAIPSLAPVFVRFPFLRSKVVDVQAADTEWRTYLDSGLSPSPKKVDEFWKDVAKETDDDGNPKYAHLLEVINFFRIMAVSNAIVERFHSHTKLIKTPSRNKLQNRTLKALMATKFAVMKDVVHFEPSMSMLMAQLSRDQKENS